MWQLENESLPPLNMGPNLRLGRSSPIRRRNLLHAGIAHLPIGIQRLDRRLEHLQRRCDHLRIMQFGRIIRVKGSMLVTHVISRRCGQFDQSGYIGSW